MKKMRNHPTATFLVLAVSLYLVATAGFDVFARMTVGGKSISEAVSEHLHFAADAPIGTLVLLVPFLLLGLMCALVATRKGFDRGVGVLMLGALLLGFLYFNGFQDSQEALKIRKWTAAALAIGLLPFLSVPILLACLVVSFFLRSKKGEEPDSSQELSPSESYGAHSARNDAGVR